MTRNQVMIEIMRIRTGPMTVGESQKKIRELLEREYPESKEITVQEICDLMDKSKEVGSVILYADGSCVSRNKVRCDKTAYNHVDEFAADLAKEEAPPIPQPEDKVDDVCGNCRFFAEPLKINGGDRVCRRHAPVFVPPNAVYLPAPAFPLMDRNDWCGDWEKKEGE